MNNDPKLEKLIRFDWALKHILRDKVNFDVLEGFLSAILQDDDIHILQLLESESDRDSEQLKYNRVDLLIQDSQGRYLIIEIQNQYETDYLYRLLFGTSKIIIDTLELGKPYRNVAKVISINILYFNLGRGDDYVYYGCTKFVGLHTQEPLQLRTREPAPNGQYYLRQVNIEKEIFPEYYLIQVERFTDVIQSDLDEWIYLLKHEEVPVAFKAKHIDKARRKLSIMQMAQDQRRRYERYLMDVASERDVLETTHREGEAKGRREGLAETAQRMRAKGYAFEEIADLTGLALADLESLFR